MSTTNAPPFLSPYATQPITSKKASPHNTNTLTLPSPPHRLFLYAFLATLLVGTVYFIYSTWLKAFFPQQKRKTRGPGTSTRKSGAATASATAAATTTADAPVDSAFASGAAKPYDESWIPAQHLQRPEAKRVRSGTPKTRAK